jgi:hypothetical protein
MDAEEAIEVLHEFEVTLDGVDFLKRPANMPVAMVG